MANRHRLTGKGPSEAVRRTIRHIRTQMKKSPVPPARRTPISISAKSKAAIVHSRGRQSADEGSAQKTGGISCFGEALRMAQEVRNRAVKKEMMEKREGVVKCEPRVKCEPGVCNRAVKKENLEKMEAVVKSEPRMKCEPGVVVKTEPGVKRKAAVSVDLTESSADTMRLSRSSSAGTRHDRSLATNPPSPVNRLSAGSSAAQIPKTLTLPRALTSRRGQLVAVEKEKNTSTVCSKPDGSEIRGRMEKQELQLFTARGRQPVETETTAKNHRRQVKPDGSVTETQVITTTRVKYL